MSEATSYKTLEHFKTALQDKGLKALDEIYLQYKDEFYGFCNNYNLEPEEIQDIYQDAIIVFYENVLSGKLSILTSSLKTYLFSIGKYAAFNVQKNKNRLVVLDKTHLENLDLSHLESEDESETNNELVQKALKNMGENCREILVLFYYHGYTIEDLTEALKYKNENVVRSHKSRCLKTLKNLIKNDHPNNK